MLFWLAFIVYVILYLTDEVDKETTESVGRELVVCVAIIWGVLIVPSLPFYKNTLTWREIKPVKNVNSKIKVVALDGKGKTTLMESSQDDKFLRFIYGKGKEYRLITYKGGEK